MLEQQWQRDTTATCRPVPTCSSALSKNVKYTFDPTRPEGERITSVTINGEPLDPAASYRVATFSFLAAGGDNFRAFTEGTAVDSGLVDHEAWIDYLTVNSPVSPDFARRSLAVTGLASDYAAGDHVSLTLPKLDLTSLGTPSHDVGRGDALPGGCRPDRPRHVPGKRWCSHDQLRPAEGCRRDDPRRHQDVTNRHERQASGLRGRAAAVDDDARDG